MEDSRKDSNDYNLSKKEEKFEAHSNEDSDVQIVLSDNFKIVIDDTE